jgi:hypothetical protein
VESAKCFTPVRSRRRNKGFATESKDRAQPGQFAVPDVDEFPILRHWYAVYPAGRQLSGVARGGDRSQVVCC